MLLRNQAINLAFFSRNIIKRFSESAVTWCRLQGKIEIVLIVTPRNDNDDNNNNGLKKKGNTVNSRK